MKKRLIAAVLSVLMLFGVFPVQGAAAGNAEEGGGQQVPAVSASAVADADTRYSYEAIFNLDNTRSDGRIWTDKTVMAGNMTFTGNLHYPNQSATGAATIEKEEGEDFLVSYSALASTITVVEETEVPIDLVMVLDLSPEMAVPMTKLEGMLDAAENAANSMLALNANNRVAIVGYSSDNLTMLELGHYASVKLAYHEGMTDMVWPDDIHGYNPSNFRGYVTCEATLAAGGTASTVYFPIFINVQNQFDTTVNKYTQLALYSGMELLTVAEPTIQMGEGETIYRQPAMILLSEGGPMIGSTNLKNPTLPTKDLYGVEHNDRGVEIWRNRNVENGKENPDERHAQVFATLLTAAYMKKQVSAYYSNTYEGQERTMQIYTMGVNTSAAASPELAEVALNPRLYLSSESANSFSDDFISYANDYFGENPSNPDADGMVSLPDAGVTQHTTDFNRTEDNLGLTGIEDLMYNDNFFDVSYSMDWGGIFDVILAQVVGSRPRVPTQVDETGENSGFITYTDPIGEYMEVKDVKAMIINDVIYENPTKSEPIDDQSGNKIITYTFSGLAGNAVYGSSDISNIVIQVVRAPDGKETMHIDIPAALLPLRQTTITKDTNGVVIGFSHNNAYPFRLVYSVGLQDMVLNKDNDSVNMDKVSDTYIAENTVDGQVQFYAGYYSGEPEIGGVGNQGRTIGDAVVTYVPATDNPFYYVEANTPLYVLKNNLTEIPDIITQEYLQAATGKFDTTQTYYFEISFYVATSTDSGAAAVEINQWVSRPGTSLRADSIETYTDSVEGQHVTNQLYLKAGEPRLGNLNDFLREKGTDNNTPVANPTGTAAIQLYLYNNDETGADGAKHSFEVYQGNNGRLSAPLPSGTLSVTKQVVNGERAATSEFAFEIRLTHTDDPAHTEGKITIGGVEFTNGVGQFKLKAGETKVFDISHDHLNGVKWTVQETTQYTSEAEAKDWSTALTGTADEADEIKIDVTEKSASGTITPAESEAVTFTNTYTTPTGTLTVGKTVTGDSLDMEVFTFRLTLTEGNSAYTDSDVTMGSMPISLDTNGSYTFRLSDTQTATFTIPENVHWTVEETSVLSGNWATDVTIPNGNGTADDSNRSASGSISRGKTDTATFTNSYTSPGALLIEKEVVGAEPTESYNFTVMLKDSNGNAVSGTFGDVKFDESGTATISLPAGSSINIQHIPAEIQWTVTEDISTLDSGWTTTANGQNGSTASGEIVSARVSTAAFVNSAPGSLTISKTVEGAEADENGYEFEIALTDANGAAVSGEFPVADSTEKITLNEGKATVTVQAAEGGSLTITEIPAEMLWTVRETSTLGSGWSTTANGEAGAETSGTIQAGRDSAADFVNTYTPPGPGLTYVLHYETGGGTEYPDERYSPNATVALNKTPVREGYTFTGWYADAALTEPIDSVQMTSDRTVYAGWRATGVPDWLNGDDHFAYVIGYPDGTVRPLDDISRAEVATIVFRLLDADVRDANLTAENAFEDVVADAWYNTAISTLAQMGILHGRTETDFEPDAPITRAEFAAIFARFDASGARAEDSFTDIAGHWAEADIGKAAALGWILGYEDGTFHPDASITRAEAMALINRVLQRLPEEEEDLLSDMNVWPDNQPGVWYYLPVQEATNSHDFQRKGDGVHESWSDLREDPDWIQYT